MGRKKAPQGTPAILVLREARVRHMLHAYETNGNALEGKAGYGDEAATALGVAPERIFKTLIVSSDGELGVAVVLVAGTLNLKAYAAAGGHKKARLADPATAQRATGYVLGGISPLGQKRALPTIVDESALRFDTIYVSAGRRGLQVELAPADLIRLTRATTAALT